MKSIDLEFNSPSSPVAFKNITDSVIAIVTDNVMVTSIVIVNIVCF